MTSNHSHLGMGLVVGLIVGIAYAVLAGGVVVVQLFSGSPVDWVEAVGAVAYSVMAFPIAGAVVGGLFRLGGSWPGAIVVGMSGALAPSIGASVLLIGPGNLLSDDSIALMITSTVLFGLAGAVAVNRVHKHRNAESGARR